MDFELSDEQRLLAQTASDFLRRRVSKATVRELERDARGFTVELWREMAEMGWLGLAIPEAYGGVGGSFLDLVVLLEEMGKACLPGPFFSTVVLGAMTLVDAGSESQKQDLLPKVVEGDAILTVALTEPSGTWKAEGITTKAIPKGNDYVIDGSKLFVPDARISDWIVCVARTGEQTEPVGGITLFLVDAKDPRITSTPLKTIACDKQFELVFGRVMVPKANLLGEVDGGWPVVERMLRRAAVAKCAEMVGGAQHALEMTVEYAKDRSQFDRPIGSFQAVQHHCADMSVALSGCRLITSQAAWMLSQGVPCDKEVAMAKAWVSDSYSKIVALGHQVHGGIGFTEEHDLQLYSRRAKAAELAYGDATLHRDTLAKAMGILA